MKPLLLATLATVGLAISACSAATDTGAAARATKTVEVTETPAPSQSGSAAAPSPASTLPSLSSPPSAAPGCLTRYLHGSIGLSQGTAGAVELAVVFKNIGSDACTLYGYPGVAQAAGSPVTDIGQPSTENPATSRVLITLQPGGYANATLQITDAANYPASRCDPVAATWLAVIPPNQTVPLYIEHPSTACRSMKVKLLTVTTVQAGNGG
jgi:Protein of unknown function (DUF4232)